jgi:DNA-binding MarR family transcriptional regulator
MSKMPDTQERLAVLQQLGRTYRTILSAFEAQIGHGLPRWRILLSLYERSEPCAQKALVEKLGTDPGALTRQLKALEELGWISRCCAPTDNRVSHVILTERGRAEVQACLPLRTGFIDQLLGGMSEQDLAMLQQLLAGLEQRCGRAD